MAHKGFRRTFLTGLVIVLPAWVTLWILSLVFGLFAGAVTPVVLKVIEVIGLGAWSVVAWVDYVAPVVSVALSVFSIYLVGLVGGNVLGRQVIALVDRFLLQVPFVRGIYKATRQFFDTFAKPRGFNRVVLLEYPRKGLWTLALVTGTARGEVRQNTTGTMISVFVPTTPNPTSGFLLFVDERDVVPLKMSVEDALKMIVSGGVVSPEEPALVTGEAPAKSSQ
jgi:uncharacterized membrane protein